MILPARSGFLNWKPIVRVSFGSRVIRSILSSALTRDCACLAFVALAEKRRTKSSIRAIWASCLAIDLPSAISRAACSLRQLCHVPAKNFARPASISSTEVPTASRNQRSCATSTIADS